MRKGVSKNTDTMAKTKTITGIRAYDELPDMVRMIRVERERQLYVLSRNMLESSREKLEKAVRFNKKKPWNKKQD